MPLCSATVGVTDFWIDRSRGNSRDISVKFAPDAVVRVVAAPVVESMVYIKPRAPPEARKQGLGAAAQPASVLGVSSRPLGAVTVPKTPTVVGVNVPPAAICAADARKNP